jgi:hypothetical protein
MLHTRTWLDDRFQAGGEWENALLSVIESDLCDFSFATFSYGEIEV